MSFLADLDAFAQVWLLSTVPYLELRVGIPYGIAMGLHPVLSTIAGILGTMTEFILSLGVVLLLRMYRSRSAALDAFFTRLDTQAQQRSRRWVQYGAVGLVLAVALPIPGTGSWTGIALAQLLGMPMRLTFPLISFGIGLSGAFVGMVATGIIGFLRL